MALYIGVMSGTSLDGVDVAIADISEQQCRLIAATTYAYPADLQHALSALIRSPQCHLAEFAQLDIALGRFIADCIAELLTQQSLTPDNITAIGSHGHTVFHQPDPISGFSLQIGNGHHIAAATDITTVADFRQRDMALHGQGAPLVPAFHHAMFAHASPACIVANIGGIANITVLAQQQAVIGYDTGPGNGLMNAWIQRHQQLSYDDKGQWANKGRCHPELLAQMLADPYFAMTSPKSTGAEYFNLNWIDRQLATYPHDITDCDVQATLLQLTAESVTQAIQVHTSNAPVYLCGGGVHNTALVAAIQRLLPTQLISSTSELGIDPDWVEACAFAWLAYRTLNGKSGNLSSVTGASAESVLGAIYPAYRSSSAS